jgi:transposase InsO family protein
LLGPLLSADYIFVVVDYYSRFFELSFTKSTTAEKLVSILSRILVTHGLPLSIRTDNGPQFISECFNNFLVENGIEQQMTTPLWPQANGEIEQQNRSILKRLRIAQAEGRNP